MAWSNAVGMEERNSSAQSRTNRSTDTRTLHGGSPTSNSPRSFRGRPSRFCYLDEPITVSDLAEKTDNYRNTVNRIVKRLRERGIVAKREGTYVLNEDFVELNRFARSLVTHRHVVNAPAPGTILWETIDEFLFQTTTEIDDERYFLTGPHRFAAFDLPLLTTNRIHYFYSERITELHAADVVCHMLLIDDGARFMGYCSLLIAKEDIEPWTLQDRASHYGLTETIDDLIEYLETEGENGPTGIASWNEFQRLAREYEVDV